MPLAVTHLTNSRREGRMLPPLGQRCTNMMNLHRSLSNCIQTVAGAMAVIRYARHISVDISALLLDERVASSVSQKWESAYCASTLYVRLWPHSAHT
jgi:hypothetical protein